MSANARDYAFVVGKQIKPIPSLTKEQLAAKKKNVAGIRYVGYGFMDNHNRQIENAGKYPVKK